MNKKIWSLVVLVTLITILAFPFASFRLTQALPNQTGIVWAAPGKPGPGPGKPGPGGPRKPHPKPKPQPLMGTIIRVNRDKVAINIGAAVGVHRGMIFSVKRFKGPKFKIIAEIKAERVRLHATDCRVIKWFTPERRIGPHDRVEKR